jgi:hypothetical protein
MTHGLKQTKILIIWKNNSPSLHWRNGFQAESINSTKPVSEPPQKRS